MLNKGQLAFTHQSREEIVRAHTNHSTSKQLWSFDKQTRFAKLKTQCPHAFYANNRTAHTLSNLKFTFAKSLRRTNTETPYSPLPGTYNIPNDIKNRGSTFGASRSKCQSNSYINQQILKNPGPNSYANGKDQESKGKGFTMRPKTAKHRNYFIEDKQHSETPGPASYHQDIENKPGTATLAKFKSIILGSSGLMKKEARFSANTNHVPGPNLYEPFGKNVDNRSTGGALNMHIRDSFIDEIRNVKDGPGPGDYRLPSEFGNYRRIKSYKPKRMFTQ